MLEVSRPREARGRPRQAGLTADAVRAAIEPVLRRAHERFDLRTTVRVVATARDLPPGPGRESTLRTPDAYAYYDTGTGGVYLIADRLESMNAAYIAAAHEIVGHLAMEQVVTDWPQMTRVIFDRLATTARGAAILRDLNERYPVGEYSEATRAKEFLAIAVEEMHDVPLLQRLMRRVRDAVLGLLRQLGIRFDVPDADLDRILFGAERHLRRGPRQEPAGRAAALRRSVRALLASPANRERAPFVSEMVRQVGELPTTPLPASGWAGAINRLVNLGKVKAAEVGWSGVHEWLKLQRGKVSHEDLMDWLRGNRVDVHVTDMEDERFEEWTQRGDRDDHRTILLTLSMPGSDATFSGELMFVAPADYASDPMLARDQFAAYMKDRGLGHLQYQLTMEEVEDDALGYTYTLTNLAYTNWSEKDHEAVRDLILTRFNRLVYDEHTDTPPRIRYVGTHYEEPNIIAHLRMTDRVDSEGRRVLFIEEIQSDWGQDVRDMGTPVAGMPELQPMLERMTALYNELMALDEEWSQAGIEWVAETQQRFSDFGLSPPGRSLESRQKARREQIIAERQRLRALIREIEVNQERPPRGPFVEVTEHWVTLALKQAVRLAANEGHEAVVLPDGQQVADIYQLDRHVSRIVYRPHNRMLYAYDLRGNRVVTQEVETPEKLRRLVGAELSARLQQQVDQLGVTRREMAEAGRDYVELTGDDLVIGGHGMRSFYDTMVRSAAKKLMSRVGGRMGRVGIDGLHPGPDGKYHSIEMDDALVERAQAGLPLFALGRRPDDTTGFTRWTEGGQFISSADTEGYDHGPVVFEAFRGTTRAPEVFVTSGDPMGALGRGPYFSTELADIEHNYGMQSPDRLARIYMRYNTLLEESSDDPSFVEETILDYLDATGREDPQNADMWREVRASYEGGGLSDERLTSLVHAALLWFAEAQVVGGGVSIMPVYVKMLVPFDMRPNGLRFVDHGEDDYADGPMRGPGIASAAMLLDAITEVAERNNVDARLLSRHLLEQEGGFSAYDVLTAASRHIDVYYDDDGEQSSPGQFVQDVARAAGFDGLIQDADVAFGTQSQRRFAMPGVRPGTLHLVPLYPERQVKSAIGNIGTYGLDQPSILKARGRLSPEERAARDAERRARADETLAQKVRVAVEARRIREGHVVVQGAPLSGDQWDSVRRIAMARLTPEQRQAIEIAERAVAEEARAAEAEAVELAERARVALGKMPTPVLSSVPLMTGARHAKVVPTGQRLADGKRKPTVADVARTLRSRVLKHVRRLSAPGGIEAAARAMAHEALYSLSQDGSGKGWYNRKVHEAIANAAVANPDILLDPRTNFFFRVILAVTSNGMVVRDNFYLQTQVMEEWQRTGRLPLKVVGGGPRGRLMATAFRKVNELVDKYGWEHAEREMLNTRSVGEIQREFEIHISGENVDTTLPTAVGLGGPKIGNFYANLSGHFDSPTMDLWVMRTIGRLDGRLLQTGARLGQYLQTLVRLIPQSGEVKGVSVDAIRQEVAAYLELPEEQRLDPEETLRVLPNTRRWMLRQHVEFARGTGAVYPDTGARITFNDKSPLNVLSRNMKANLAAVIDRPAGGNDRNEIRAVFNRALQILQAAGINLTAADLQAVLWYHEKKLYEKIGNVSEIAKPWDYGSAARWGVARFLRLIAPELAKRPRPVRDGQPGAGERGVDSEVRLGDGQDDRGVEEEGREGLLEARGRRGPVSLRGQRGGVVVPANPLEFGRMLKTAFVRGVGDPVYQAITRAAHVLLAPLKLVDETPEEFRRAMRALRAEYTRAWREASQAAREGVKMTAAERELISDYIEKELAAGVTPPHHVIKLAASMQLTIANQQAELLRLKMLSQASLQRWGGKYLARYYAPKLIDWDKLIQRYFRHAAEGGIAGGRLKGRGLWESVDAADVPAWIAQGYEVRDPRYNPAVTTGKVTVWRDFTKAERTKMGEIRDGVYRFAHGYMESARDIAKGRFLERLVVDGIAVDVADSTHTFQIPNVEIPGTGGVSRFGAASGKWVSQAVATELMRVVEPTPAVWRNYLKALSLWKEGKTAMHPGSHVNNLFSNVIMADLAGVSPWDIGTYNATRKEYITQGPHFREAQDAGLFGNDFYGAELRELLPDPLAAGTNAATAASSLPMRFLSVLYRWSGLRTYREAMGAAYGAVDQFFKLMIYRKVRAEGGSIEDGVAEANRWFFDYSALPPGARLIRNTMLPFVSYAYFALPALVYGATHHPERMLKWVALFSGVNWLGYEMLFGALIPSAVTAVAGVVLPGDEEEEPPRDEADEAEAYERGSLPDFARGDTAWPGVPKAVRLPWHGPAGEAVFFDLTRKMPLGDLFDWTSNVSGAMDFPAPLTPSHPILTIYTALFANQDNWRGRIIVDDALDDTWEAARKRAGYLARELLPNIPYIPGTNSWDKLMHGAAGTWGHPIQLGPLQYTGTDYAGRRQTIAYAVADVLGLRTIRIDPEFEYDRKTTRVRGTLRDIRAAERRDARDFRLPQDEATFRARAAAMEADRARALRRLDEIDRNRARRPEGYGR